MIILDLLEKRKHLIILGITIFNNNFKGVINEGLFRMGTKTRL